MTPTDALREIADMHKVIPGAAKMWDALRGSYTEDLVVSHGTLARAAEIARAALAAAEKDESELVAAINAVLGNMYVCQVMSSNIIQQLRDARDSALTKHTTTEHAKKE